MQIVTMISLALISLAAGMLLLAKTRRESLGKFFSVISWFIIVTGLALIVFGAVSNFCACRKTQCSPDKMYMHSMKADKNCCYVEMNCCAENCKSDKMSKGHCARYKSIDCRKEKQDSSKKENTTTAEN